MIPPDPPPPPPLSPSELACKDKGWEIFEKLTEALELIIMRPENGVWIRQDFTWLDGEICRRWTHFMNDRPLEHLHLAYKDDRKNALRGAL